MSRADKITPDSGLPRAEREPLPWLEKLTRRLAAFLRALIDSHNLLLDGYMLYVSALPTAEDKSRGRMIVQQGGAGVIDKLYWCRKKADGTYEWLGIAFEVITSETVTASQFLLPSGSVIGQFDTTGMQIRSGFPIAVGSGVLLTLERHATGGTFKVYTSNAAGTADVQHFIIPGKTDAPMGADDGVSVDFVDVAEVEIINAYPGVGNFRSSPQLSLVGSHGLAGTHQWQLRAAMTSLTASEWRLRRIIDGGAPVDILHLSEPADTETALLIRRNVGGALSLQRVSMGGVDSGGAGFKVLRVPN